MKKILVAIIGILCFVPFANGQEKGDSYINAIAGISAGSNTVKYGGKSETNPTGTTFLFGAGYAFFPANHFRIGVDAGYELQTISDEDGYRQNTNVITIGPSIAYYTPITSTFYYTPQLDIAAAFGKYSEKVSSYSQFMNCTGVAFGISPVKFEFRPTDHFGFDIDIMSLSYAHLNYKDFDYSSNTLGFSICINPSVGFKYYF